MNASDQGESSIDFDALARKYAEERAKRLRSDSIGQYQAPTGKLSAFARDPNADPAFTRDPIRRDAEVLVIGGGFGGLLAGVHLREEGVKDVIFVDKAGDLKIDWADEVFAGAVLTHDGAIKHEATRKAVEGQ